MRLYTFKDSRKTHVGAELDGGLVKLPFHDMLELIRGGNPALALAKKLVAKTKPNSLIPLSKVALLAPIPRPGKIWCSGLNYKGHIEENPKAKFLGDPRFFSKLPECVIGPGEAIRHPGERFQLDWEVELAVVFGRRGYRLTQEQAMRHVFGYTILHDVSSRYVQFKDNNEQMGKNFATFSPMGPCLVTKDEIPAPEDCRLSLKVNGVTRQDFDNQDWCFSLRRMIEWLSMGLPLEPGDVMTTGTGKGIGFFAQPPCFLQPGDVCELEISGIGKLVNPVKADPYVFKTQPNS
jgi:2-keto-4-pentenoate hydratase/2-oxohepta-3-ene-1,7-dioic acid hydratase in catechol pathway